MVYASINRIYYSRNINFMYLLEGKPAPDHATFARFISLHFAHRQKVLYASKKLKEKRQETLGDYQ